MTPSLTSLLLGLIGLTAGGLIGAGFAVVQETARQRNERRQQRGTLKSGWGVMPGAGGRVAGLLIALVLIQMVCPLLFNDGVQWWVSTGVAGGYGCVLFRRLARRKADRA